MKIGDFGLARDVYKSDYYRGGGYLPVKWMSPESLTEHIFTTQSDVWSFGVLIWEIMTLGQRPYAEKGNSEVRNFVCHNRGHLEVPQRCPEKLGQELLKCWAFNPSDRPTFSGNFILTNFWKNRKIVAVEGDFGKFLTANIFVKLKRRF